MCIDLVKTWKEMSELLFSLQEKWAKIPKRYYKNIIIVNKTTIQVLQSNIIALCQE